LLQQKGVSDYRSIDLLNNYPILKLFLTKLIFRIFKTLQAQT
jgi:hypothetical protein